MKKIINKPEMYVDEMLDGLCMAHPSLKRTGETNRVVTRSSGIEAGKVGIVSGGGSGHLPLFTGYVGEGLLDACAIGNVFEGPTVASCGEAIRQADGGAGVLCLYGNYGGDRMNFDMACEMAELDSIPTRTVLGTDDIASAPPAEGAKRRGVAGIVFAYKAAGAKAVERASLDEVAAAAADAVARTRTIGVALSPCRIPTAARPSFAISEDEIEFGMGIHGEPGIWRDRVKSADELVNEMTTRILADKPAWRASASPSWSTASARHRSRSCSSCTGSWEHGSRVTAIRSPVRWSVTSSPRWKWRAPRSASASLATNWSAC